MLHNTFKYMALSQTVCSILLELCNNLHYTGLQYKRCLFKKQNFSKPYKLCKDSLKRIACISCIVYGTSEREILVKFSEVQTGSPTMMLW